MATPTLTMARGLLMLSPPLMPSPLPMLRPIPGWLMATAITLTAMVMLDTEDTMATPTLTTARGLLMLSPLLMPSPLLMLRPIPGWLTAMAITPIATAMPDTEDTTATLTATMATTPTPTDMPTTGTMATPTLMDTGARSKPR